MKGPPPPLVAELSALGYALMRLLLAQAKEVFAKEGFSLLQAEVLRLVREGVDTPSHLAEHLGVQPSQVSHLLASLEEAGFLERSLDSGDRRRVHLHLTPKGEEVQARLREAWLLAYAKHLSRLDEGELLLFRDLLKKLTEVGRG
ncbi:MarR family winged helix-turn-helix transcriptional regulator [Thermus sediminis]|uniref:MarR family winged helix-turn-helix transcriptional regulator n=1 Tax=Thermus sediminis TaxID=1761908 RepID=UPI000E3D9CAA|nr:MarR family transcriptional regulator [Thermus sediminis]